MASCFIVANGVSEPFPRVPRFFTSGMSRGSCTKNRSTEKLDPSHLTSPENKINFDRPNASAIKQGDMQAGKEVNVHDSSIAGDQKENHQTAFDQLVLPDGHKDMVQSLIAQHLRDKEAGRKPSRRVQQMDIVRGKGKSRSLHSIFC